MYSFEYTITDEVGLHARPAGLLVKKVKELNCAVTITKGDKTVDASKIMAIMGLGVKYRDMITVSVEEDDSILENLKTFFRENL